MKDERGVFQPDPNHTIIPQGSDRLRLAPSGSSAADAGGRGGELARNCHYPLSAGVSPIEPTQSTTQTLPPTQAHLFCRLLPDDAEKFPCGGSNPVKALQKNPKIIIIKNIWGKEKYFPLLAYSQKSRKIKIKLKKGLTSDSSSFPSHMHIECYRTMHAGGREGESENGGKHTDTQLWRLNSNAVSYLLQPHTHTHTRKHTQRETKCAPSDNKK